jgi:hypothetical protein
MTTDTTNEPGNALFRRVSAKHDAIDTHWSRHPWMVDAYTGDETRDDLMRKWLLAQIGHQAHPVHRVRGEWQRGLVTINGWTWIGFATREQMYRFLAKWTPDDWEIKPQHVKPAD